MNWLVTCNVASKFCYANQRPSAVLSLVIFSSDSRIRWDPVSNASEISSAVRRAFFLLLNVGSFIGPRRRESVCKV